MLARPLLGTALALLCGALLAACGGADAPQRSQAAPPPPPAAAAQSPDDVPSGVPLTSTRDGDPAAIKVIRLWSDALRHSDVKRAAALWAVPSKVQNGTPVLTLATAGDVRVFNDSLTCGSRLVSARGAEHGFTIAVFLLTRRPGADCGTGAGHHARTAILVRGGKIAEWYRLPTNPGAGAPDAPPAPAEPNTPVI